MESQNANGREAPSTKNKQNLLMVIEERNERLPHLVMTSEKLSSGRKTDSNGILFKDQS